MEMLNVDLLRGVKVVVLGDVMLDRFVYGTVDRVSPEAPIPVLLLEREASMLGGAGNVARNVAALQGVAELIGVIGNDPDGEFLSGKLSSESGVDSRLIVLDSERTTVKTRYVCGVQQIMRLDVENVHVDLSTAYPLVIEQLRKSIADAGSLVLSDYGKGLLSPEIVAAAISIAREVGVPVIVDPKTRDFRRYRGADVVTPNAKEAELASGISCRNDEGAAEAAKAIAKQSEIGAVLVTRGAQGMTLYAPRSGITQPLHLPTAASEVFDVTGAGDTVVATLAILLASGVNIELAAKTANVAAGIVVAKAGTAAVYAEELAHALESIRLGEATASRDLAAKRAAEWRLAGLKVGFTNGCFDLIHPGHVKLLEGAKAACDRLIVAINSDASVRRLKGEGRPVQSETARGTVLASMRSVDLVTCFDESTPLELIKEVRPDVLIKGSDYTVDQVVGADLVHGWGGQVALIPLVSGNSTTSIIHRAKSDAPMGV